jgi:hypothetical protein
MTDVLGVNDGAFDLEGAVGQILLPIFQVFEAAGTNLDSARYPFVHPEDWIAKGRNFGIWSFETQRQYENFVHNKAVPFDDTSPGKWVIVRNASTGGTVYGLFTIGSDFWLQLSIDEMIFLQIITAADPPSALNNIVRELPPNPAPSLAGLSDAETLPAETTEPRTSEGPRIITSANLSTVPVSSPLTPTPPSYASASGSGDITITEDDYGLSNVNGAAPTTLLNFIGEEVILSPDTFLQGVQGSLSNVASQLLGGLFNQFLSILPQGVQDFLSATGITAQLQEGITNIFNGDRSNSASRSLGKLTDAQKEAIELLESPKMREIAAKVPSAISDFKRLQSALKKWNESIESSITDPELRKYFKDRADKIANGEDPGPVDTAKLEQLTSQSGMEFDENPATLLADIARAAEAVQNKIQKEVNDTTFQKLGSAAAIASAELAQVFVKNADGKWVFSQTPEEDKADSNFAFEVEDGVIIDG